MGVGTAVPEIEGDVDEVNIVVLWAAIYSITTETITIRTGYIKQRKYERIALSAGLGTQLGVSEQIVRSIMATRKLPRVTA